jgi:hypothetical protein
MTTLEAKLLAQASVFPALTALLTASPFPWYDGQLQQGSLYPAVVVEQITNPQVYSLTGRMATSTARVQFTIWDTDPERARAVEQALFQFLDNFNAVGPSNLPAYPVEVVGGPRQNVYATPAPKRFTRQLDAMIFQNQTL